MNHSLWQKSFGALQVFSMMAGLYQALAANQILGAMTSNPIHFGLLTFSASIFAVIGYLTSGFLIDKIGVIKIFIFAQISLFFANMILFGFVFTSPSVYGWIMVVSSSFFFISFEALSRGQVIIEFFHKVDSGPVGVRAVSFDLLIINVAKLFGFGLGSLALTFFDPKWALLTNALSYLVVYVWISKQKHYFTSPPPTLIILKLILKNLFFHMSILSLILRLN